MDILANMKGCGVYLFVKGERTKLSWKVKMPCNKLHPGDEVSTKLQPIRMEATGVA